MDPVTMMTLGQAAGGAIGGIANLFDSGDPGEEHMRRALALIEAVQDPQFDFRQLSPPEIQFIAQVDPVTYSARVPDDVKIMAESGARSNQVQALGGMEQIASEGMPMVDRLAAEGAVNSMANESGAAQNAILQELAARGRLGGGQEIQARMAGNIGQNQLRADMGRNLAQDALSRRFAGLESSSGMAGELRSADQIREAENARMINNMNQYVAGLESDAERWNAETEMQNRIREAEGQNRAAELNQTFAYDVARDNMERSNRLEQQLRDFQLNQAGQAAGGEANLATGARAEQASRQRGLTNTLGGLGALGGGLYDYMGGATAPTPSAPTTLSGPSMNNMMTSYGPTMFNRRPLADTIFQ